MIEIAGLELHGFHGVLDEEREQGQPFVFDLRVEAPEVPTDRIEDALDYRALVELVREVSDGTRFRLLEALAAAVADAIVERFGPRAVTVRVRKPEVRRLGLPVEYAAVSVERG